MTQLRHSLTRCRFLLVFHVLLLEVGKPIIAVISHFAVSSAAHATSVCLRFLFDLFRQYISLFVNMFLTFEVIATFGVSAVVSFAISSALLLLVAAKRGLLRKRETRPGMTNAALLPPTAPPKALLAEQTPLQAQ